MNPDTVLHLPNAQLAAMGVTIAQVNAFPRLLTLNDKIGYAAADACRKGLVGVDGTNIQMVNFMTGNAGFGYGQACKFLVTNRILPTVGDVMLIARLINETASKLEDGDMHAVNRRQVLTAEGVVKPTGDDVVPEAVRSVWLAPVP